VNYNILGDELLFKTPTDSTVQAFVDPVKSFSARDAKLEGTDQTDVTFSSGFPAVDDQSAKTFYQVVGDGKVKLLRYYKKKVVETQDFTSQKTNKSLMGVNSYYLFANNQITKIKPSQKTILAAMNDKADKVQEYLKSNKVDFKSDVALAKLFAYYNSL
jgi:ribosomal protein S15P/S13E